MKTPFLIAVSLVIASTGASTATQTSSTANVQPPGAPSAEFRLYRAGIKTKKQTQTITASEVKAGRSIYQVFRSRSGQKEELFRVAAGEAGDSNAARFWNYGIVDEADFNGDGLPDYSWYGGDDTGFEMYLFLSSSSERGYTKINLIKTLQAAWNQRFHSAVPKFDELDSDYSIRSLLLKRYQSGLVFIARIEGNNSHGKGKKTHLFNIDHQDFKF